MQGRNKKSIHHFGVREVKIEITVARRKTRWVDRSKIGHREIGSESWGLDS
jgi:hypothetical protein